MSINVYAWPPVHAIGSEWTEVAPVQVSRSIITGAEYRSAAQRTRRFATIEARGIGKDMNGAGYMEVLKKYLAGIHAVQLHSYPINWWLAGLGEEETRAAALLDWTAGSAGLDWTAGGTEMIWFAGAVLSGTTGTDAAGFPIITIDGLPANTPVARPGEFVTVFGPDRLTEVARVMIARPATSDGSGAAVVRLVSAPGSFTAARVNIGTSDTGVFRPVGSCPRAVQPLAGDWSYTWEFREVFADEVGGFVEIDPWH
ncbi:hypothetical protein PVT71_13600 [Salipiger sp. H15]|uniref:Minor tail protein n=1 Tax=Alloyangia sp. H15 TaxID=3029062 RepID=A0AAU8AGE3_9RHOB